MPNTSFPDSAVVYILDDIPGEGEFQGTGVIIGPHTILTAAHLVYDAGTGASADAISLYPGFTPDSGTYNPPGALGGLQSIHTIKVAENGGQISATASQGDFAVIDTSADLTGYGRFALDPSFTSGDVVVSGYPASNKGHLSGLEATVYQDGDLSDIGTAGLALSPGYSGGPLYDRVERNGSLVPAVVGTVSTNNDAMKLTKAKVALIRHWIAADASLYAGGQDAPRGLTPQIDGTVSGDVDAARVTAPSGSAALAAAIASPDAAQATLAKLHRDAVLHCTGAPVPSHSADLLEASQPGAPDSHHPVLASAGLDGAAAYHGLHHHGHHRLTAGV